MDHYIVSARKYRPSTFASVVGQKALTATLKNAIATDRLAHAYLFCGSRGVGKTSCARIFAKTINCSNRTPDGEACNECESCRSFNENRSLNIVELDAASHNGIEDIKSLIEQVMVPPTMGRYRVFIIDEVHMLSTAAFNAFLKTLEEPPEYVIFILATTEKHKIIPTILSRCQIYDFNRITINDMVGHLKYVASNEGIAVEDAALNVIARQADGAMRDALSIFDQVAASSRGNITYASTIENLNVLDSGYYHRLLDAFLAQDVSTALMVYKEVREKGFDSQFFINGLALYMRDLMVARDPQTVSLFEATDDERERMAALARKCQPTFLYKAMSLCNDADLNFRQASNKQFLVELTLIKLCQLLSPSANSGNAEGRLKTIAAMHGGDATRQSAQPTPTVAPARTPQTSTSTPSPLPAETVAATPAAPAPQPATTAQRTAHPGTNASAGAPQAAPLRKSRVSLTHGVQHKQEEVKPVSEPTRHRANPYTPDAVLVGWDAYIAAHPTAQIVINAMRNAHPTRRDSQSDVHTVVVENEIQVANLNNAMPDILHYMRNILQNDNFTLQVLVNEGESSPVTWNEREVLAHMVKNHPELEDFIKEFKLTID